MEWARCEEYVFGFGPIASAGGAGHRTLDNGRTSYILPTQARAHSVQQLRCFLANHNALSDLTAALTLLDALVSRTIALEVGGGQPLLPASDLLEGTTLAALVRVMLKCSGQPLSDLGCFNLVEQRMGLEPWHAHTIALREVLILKMMNGRVALPSLPSPSHWARAILRRAEVASPTELQARALEQAAKGTDSWVELLVERIGMTADVPPRAVAFGACVLSLVAVGAMKPDEARPRGMCPHRWSGSLLVRQDRIPRHDQLGCGISLEAQVLANAACCSIDELCLWAFKAISALQLALFSE